ncbi:MAG: hypothetical protein LBR46_00745 [Prevotella sp.]|nr:hypothetical protein [Prevotella sp.]
MNKYFDVIQLNYESKYSTLFDISKYIFKVDILFFNWIETVPCGFFGFLKFLLYYIYVLIAKLRKMKIIYLVHDKKPHTHKAVKFNNHLSELIIKDIIKRSDLLLTHATEGLDIIKSQKPEANAFFFNHPFDDLQISMDDFCHKEVHKKYDILIWSAIKPYKGIYEFLSYLKDKKMLSLYKIKIVGRIYSNEDKIRLPQIIGDNTNIELEDRSVSYDELPGLINSAKIVLFTYKVETVLSSGVLMDSLMNGATIVGNNCGAFKDLGCEGIIYSYNDYTQMIEILDDIIVNDKYKDKYMIYSFIQKNNWDNFAKEIGLKIYAL